jgi:hypothetical protein
MRITYLFLILGLLIFTQCDKIPLVKKSKLQQIDTVVNFSSVDLSPSFQECDSIIDKVKKSNCFRLQIHQKIGQELQNHQLESVFEIDEEVQVIMHVTAKGEFVFKKMIASEELMENLPSLDSILELCIEKLPKVIPATKRGIPVTTQYQLPIKISLQ